jgi:hypothetical protein
MSNRFRLKRSRFMRRSRLRRIQQLRQLQRFTRSRFLSRLGTGATRLIPLHLLGARILPRARTRRARITFALMPMVAICLLVIVFTRFTRQQVNVENQVRNRILPQLEKEFGLPLEVGRIESDYLSRVVLHDVVLGRNAKLPLGAMLQARTVTLRLNMISLLGNRDQPFAALKTVEIAAPQMFLQRDARGRLNWEKLLSGRKRTGTATTQWEGTVVLTGGRLWFEDRGIRSSTGETLLADANGIDGRLEFRGTEATEVRLAAARTYIGRARTAINGVTAAGKATIGGASKPWLALELRWPEVPAPLLASYAFPKRDVVLTSGKVGGALQLAYDGALPRTQQWLASGDVQLADVTGQTRAAIDPTTRRPLQFASLTGPVSFSNLVLATRGATLTTLGSPLMVTGTVALPENGLPRTRPSATKARTSAVWPIFDVRMESRSLDTMRFARLLPTGTTLSGGRSRVTLRLTGTPREARIGGALVTPIFAFRQAGNALRGTSINTNFSYAGDVSGGRLSARFILPQFAANLSGDNPTQSSGRGLTGELVYAGDMSGKRPVGQGRMRFTVDGFNGRSRTLGSLAGKGLTGNASFNIDGRLVAVAARFAAANAEARSVRYGAGRGRIQMAVVRYVVDGMGNRRRSPLAVDISLAQWAVRPFPGGTLPDFGAARGRMLRVATQTADLTRPLWRGVAYISGVPANEISLASLSPAMAQQARQAGISDLGALEGNLRFSQRAPGASPTVEGAFRLSRARVQGTLLNNLTGRFDLGDGRGHLTDVRAQSAFGAFAGSASFGGDSTIFALEAPRVVLNAAQINPYIATSGVAFSGTAIGRLSVNSSGGGAPLRVSFDLALPIASLRSWTASAPNVTARNALQVTSGTMRGSGILRPRGGAWRFDGDAALYAARAMLPVGGLRRVRLNGALLPAALEGTGVRGLRLAISGRVERMRDGTVTPRLNGELRFTRGAWPLPNSAQTLVLNEGHALFNLDESGLEAPRIAARWGDNSSLVRGHIVLRRRTNALAGQFLAEGIDAARLQNLLVVSNPTTPRMRGALFARLDFNGTLTAPRANAQVRLLNGAVTVQNLTVPIDMARANLDVSGTDARSIAVREAVLWARGGRVALAGTVSRAVGSPIEAGYVLDLGAKVNDLRLADVFRLVPSGRDALSTVTEAAISGDTDADGLVSGEFEVSGNTARPRVSGRAAARLVSILGVSFDEVAARVDYDQLPGGPRLVVSDMEGQSSGSRLAGSFLADIPADRWNFKLDTTGTTSDRVIRSARRLTTRAGDTVNAERLARIQRLPLRGELQATINVSGRFSHDLGRFALVAQDGDINVRTSGLRWRGRDLGILVADLELENGLVRIRDFALRENEQPVEGGPAITVSGAVPVAFDAPGLDARIDVIGGQLPLLKSFLEEIQGALGISGTNINALDALLSRWNNLPQNLEGRFDSSATLAGTWNEPTVEFVTAARDVRLGNQPLPTLDAAVRLEDGAFTIHRLELQQKVRRIPGAPALIPVGLTPTPATDGAEDDDFREVSISIAEGGRITPNGEISLDVRILNSNLSQLAPWIAALRDSGGSPIIQGELSLFDFQVRGSIERPLVTGSIEAQSLAYREYTLDRLRISVFNIANGQLSIEPGNLTVVKGGFQSSAAWGKLPWDWARGGVTPDAPIEVHLPVQTRDVGALAGAFVPALEAVAAENFSGALDISGTLQQPVLAGTLAIQNARFRADPAVFGTEFGVRAFSGSLSFSGNNVLHLDNLRGEVIRAERVDATPTGNLPAEVRAPARTGRAREAASELGGEFALNGTVALNLDSTRFSGPATIAAAQRYDLAFNLSKGVYGTPAFSGLREVTFDAEWKTGVGEAALAQRITWQLTGAGRQLPGGPKAGGTVRSAGTLELPPNIGAPDSFERARWTGNVELRGLTFDARNVARGALNGSLQLRNLTHRASTAPVLARRATIASRLSASRAAEKRSESTWADGFLTKTRVSPAVSPRLAQEEEASRARTMPGISGSLTLSDAEIIGAPIGGVGVASLLPDVPVFDLKLLIGRSVRFVTTTLRAEFTGGLEVVGTPRDPRVIGIISTRNGQIRFPSTLARITQANVEVNVMRDPSTNIIRSTAILDATARGQVGRYQITLAISGPLDFGSNNAQELRIDVSSNPPMMEGEAFALLTGTSLQGVTREEGSQRLVESEVNQAYASAFLGLLSAPLFSGVERTLEEAFGLTSITLDYRLNEPVTVEVGKAIGDRIYVSYRRSIANNRPGEPTAYTLRIDYRIKGDIQLGLQTDERGTSQVSVNKTWRF